MSKFLLLAAAVVTGVSTIATVYYISPVEISRTETPPILVDAEPSKVVDKIRSISLDGYVSHFLGEEHREREQILYLFELVQTRVSDTTVFDLKLSGDLLMQFRVEVKPQGSMSEIHVTAVSGANPFSSSPALHPYDIQLLQSVAGFLATDYVSSIVKGHPPLSGKRMEVELTRRFADDKDSIKDAARRMEKTFLAAYEDVMKAEAESYEEANYHPSDPYEEEYAMAEIEGAEKDAAQAAVNAAERAAAAAYAAGAAADAAREAAR